MHPIIFKLQKIKEDLIQKGISHDTIRIYLKENLQNYVLSALYNHHEFKNLIFYGGTCARKIYGLDRISEDLDFESSLKINFENLADFLINYFKNLELNGLSSSIQKSENIARVTLKFPLLYELKLSSHEKENLHIKVEINNRPSGDYQTILTPLMTESLSMIIRHYDIETLMACKIIACLSRIYQKGKTGIEIKGRDFYDLIWYMQKGIIPNEKRLKDADKSYAVKKAFILLDDKIALIRPDDLAVDLFPLFINKNYISSFCQNFSDFYKRYRKNY